MSKKDDKRKIREEKKAAEQRKSKLSGLLVKAAVVVLVPLALFVFYQGLSSSAQVVAPDELTASDHVRGNENAALTMTVYADFQCPACLTETDLMARAWPRINQNVKLVFRHYPLDTHRHAFLAARYAEAAARQDGFWAMHDILYANQTLWASLPNADEVFDGFVQDLGLDLDQLHADMDLNEVREKIIADQRGGTRAGVRSTPALYFNGRPVAAPRSVGELIQMVNDFEE